MLQSYDTNDAEVREKAGIEYKKRVRHVLRSHLNGRKKMEAINAYAIPVVRYPAGIITWPTEEVKQLDIKTRKLMTSRVGFHPKSSTCRLYVCRKEGGRGLQSVHGSIRDEEAKLKSYCQEQTKIDPILHESFCHWK